MSYRDMAMDAGLHIDAGVSLDEAAALLEQEHREEAERERAADAAGDCRCKPCDSPGYGYPDRAHCAACCSGSLIEEYDHHCPHPEHREMAVAQWGPLEVPF